MDRILSAHGILFHDDKLYTRGSVIASTEGICRDDSPVKLPNFHAVQYYTAVPFPSIVCYVLDFGITVRTEIDEVYSKLHEEEPMVFLDKIEAELNKSFKETAREVTNYLLYRMVQFDGKSLYANAVSSSMDENNPWGIYIAESRRLKEHGARKTFARWLVEQLERDKSDITDTAVLEAYKEIINNLVSFEREYTTELCTRIKTIIENVHLRENVPAYLDALTQKVSYTRKIQVAA